MPRSYYEDLVFLRNFDSASDLVPPIVYRHTRQGRDDRYYPYDSRHRQQRAENETSSAQKTVEELTEPGLARQGDLGWTLEYSTAYCFKHLNGNRPCIVDTIDDARQAPLGKKAPFLVFDLLDRNLFQGKLKGMVLLKWRTLSDNAPGVTSAPGVRDARICIELNTRPFEERDASLDELLDALIHQMIHAYFLVCCGKQGKSTEQDGRLLDALHFGILMYTIQEISGDCQEGPLPLTFYAHRRACRSRGANACRSHRMDLYDRGVGRSVPRPYIAIDPHGGTVGPPPNDGQSHCMHDNRRFRGADIRNWQVTSYASAIEQGMDKKDDTIYDLDVSGDLKPVERLKGPPSSTYVELVWDGKKVMAPREKVLGFDSLGKSGKKEGKYELNMPKCDFLTLKCVWDFIQHRKYSPQHSDNDSAKSRRREEPKGPPIIVHGNRDDATDGIAIHIRVFKAADSMKFSELQKYAMERLYDMSTTSEDPITALKEIYNGADSKPINAELHKWARKFLARTDESQFARHGGSSSSRDPWAGSYHYNAQSYHRGTSNYEKLISIHGDRFHELYHSNPVLKDDSKLIVAELSYPGHLTDDNPSIPTPINTHMPHMPSSSHRPYYLPATAQTAAGRHTPLTRRRSFSDYHDPISWRPHHPSRSPYAHAHAGRQTPWYSHPHSHPHDYDSHDPSPYYLRPETVIPSPLGYPVLAPTALPCAAEFGIIEDSHHLLPPPPPYYDYFSRRNGRRRRVNALTGDSYTRSRERWGDLYGLL